MTDAIPPLKLFSNSLYNEVFVKGFMYISIHIPMYTLEDLHNKEDSIYNFSLTPL